MFVGQFWKPLLSGDESTGGEGGHLGGPTVYIHACRVLRWLDIVGCVDEYALVEAVTVAEMSSQGVKEGIWAILQFAVGATSCIPCLPKAELVIVTSVLYSIR